MAGARHHKRGLKFAFAVAAGLTLAACQTAPVDRPCGVIRDDLRTVQGKTAADAAERCVLAGKWNKEARKCEP